MDDITDKIFNYDDIFKEKARSEIIEGISSSSSQDFQDLEDFAFTALTETEEGYFSAGIGLDDLFTESELLSWNMGGYFENIELDVIFTESELLNRSMGEPTVRINYNNELGSDFFDTELSDIEIIFKDKF